MTMTLSSPAFDDGKAIPPQYTCDGEDRSPELVWEGPPPGTRSFALILHDPDSRFGDFPHWIQFGIPAAAARLPEGQGDMVGVAGTNGFGRTGYGGPCPQVGEHRYVFDLYALDVESLGLQPGAAWTDVEEAMEGHLLARACLMGRYERQKPPAP